MSQMDITYQVKGKNNYLVITPSEGGHVIEYLSKMAEYNTIPGCLPMFCQIIDGNTRFYYEITGKMRLSGLASERRLSVRDGEKLLTNLIDGFLKLDQYFMSPAQCLLTEGLIFTDNLLNTFLPYYPVETGPDKDIDKLLREFFLGILGDYLMAQSGGEYYDGLLRYLIRPGFTLEKFRQMVVTQKVKSPEPAPSFEERPSQLPQPSAPLEEKSQAVPEKKQEKKGFLRGRKRTEQMESEEGIGGSLAIPGGGTISIPGGAVQIPETKGTEKKNKKEKKRRLGGLFAKKEKNLDMDAGEYMEQADAGGGSGPVQGQRESTVPGSVQPQLGGASAPGGVQPQWRGTIKLETSAAGTRTVLLSDTGKEVVGGFLNYRGRDIQINSPEFKIGRTQGDLIIPNEHMTGWHATINCVNGTHYLTDNNSTNHTSLNGTILPPFIPSALQDGDIISLAKEEMVFHKES